MQIVQTVFDVGVSIKNIDLQALKIHQIKQNIESVEKKIDKLLLNPLKVADELFSTGLNEIEAKRYKNAEKTFSIVIEEATRSLSNIKEQIINFETFKFCIHSLKLIMCSKIAKYCYSQTSKTFLPYSNLTELDQRLIAKELEKLAKKCLFLRKNFEINEVILVSMDLQENMVENHTMFILMMLPSISVLFSVSIQV